MITYEIEKKNKLKINNKFDSVFDYGTAWVFGVKKDIEKN